MSLESTSRFAGETITDRAADEQPRGGRLRWLELVVLFFVLPTIAATLMAEWAFFGLVHVDLTTKEVGRYLLVALWLFTLLCLVALLVDPRFDRSKLWRARAAPGELRRILLIWLPAAVLLALLVWTDDSAKLFSFPREALPIYLMVFNLYPWASVFPQGVVYRIFFEHRYRGLFRRDWQLILAGAAFFSYSHLVFLNWPALVLTFCGGLLFMWTYVRSRSGYLAMLEHAMYGLTVFTVGAGQYVYHGAVG